MAALIFSGLRRALTVVVPLVDEERAGPPRAWARQTWRPLHAVVGTEAQNFAICSLRWSIFSVFRCLVRLSIGFVIMMARIDNNGGGPVGHFFHSC